MDLLLENEADTGFFPEIVTSKRPKRSGADIK